MNHHPLFSNRVAVLATMHHKEKVIAPILEQELGIKVVVPKDFNTDRFGTFTREIKRVGTQIEAARLKAETILDMTGETLAIASEGTFGPHPGSPFIPCNREVVILLDKTNRLEITGQEISTETNFSHRIVNSLEQAQDFADAIGFPEHCWITNSTRTWFSSRPALRLSTGFGFSSRCTNRGENSTHRLSNPSWGQLGLFLLPGEA